MYFLFTINLSYCSVKTLAYFASPIFLLAIIVCETTWQQNIATMVKEALPDHLKYFVESSLNKNLYKTITIILSAIGGKYHEKINVIHLIIAKWSARNLHT